MKIVHDVAVTLGTALLTALLAAPFVGPAAARATDEKTILKPVASAPTLAAEGMTLSLKLEQEKYEPDAKPVLVLTAVGGTAGATAEVLVRMHTTTPVSPMARMLPMPREVWSKSVPITLKPGETRTVRLAPDKAVAAGSTAGFGLQVGEKRLAAAGYSLPAPIRLLGVGIVQPQRALTLPRGAPEIVEVAEATSDETAK